MKCRSSILLPVQIALADTRPKQTALGSLRICFYLTVEMGRSLYCFICLALCMAGLRAQQVRVIGSNASLGFHAPEISGGTKRYNTCRGSDEQSRYCSFLHNTQICFKRSVNGGKDWSDSSVVFSVPSATSCMVNSVRVAVEPRIACDQSKGAHQGRLYICWSDQKNGKGNLDVFLVFSDDQGKNWTEPILLSYHANHKHQFLPDVAVDPFDGTVYVLYLDQQNDPFGKYCDLKLMSSMNGGLKFEGLVLNKNAFRFKGADVPRLSLKAEGLCTNLGKERCCAPNWPCRREILPSRFDSSAYRFSPGLSVWLDLPEDAALTAELTKPLDASFQKILFKEKRYKKGKNRLELGRYLINLPEDNYNLTLYNGKDNAFIWILKE